MATGSVRSELVRWIGGAASVPAVQGGYRGFLAYWIGGASNHTTTPPTGANKDVFYVAGGHHPGCHAGTSIIKIGGPTW